MPTARLKAPLTNVSPSPHSTPTVPLEGISILLVEDDRDTRESLVLVLEQRGARVVAVDSVAAAFATLERVVPDVLVSDIFMPIEDGYALIRKIRLGEVGSGRRLPAVAVTGHVRTEDRRRSLLAGFDEHVPKPIEPDAFAELLRSLVTPSAAAVGASATAPPATLTASQRGS